MENAGLEQSHCRRIRRPTFRGHISRNLMFDKEQFSDKEMTEILNELAAMPPRYDV